MKPPGRSALFHFFIIILFQFISFFPFLFHLPPPPIFFLFCFSIFLWPDNMALNHSSYYTLSCIPFVRLWVILYLQLLLYWCNSEYKMGSGK